jgi:receptor protein-tyrosine kinase
MSARAASRHSATSRDGAHQAADEAIRPGREIAPIERPSRPDDKLLMVHAPNHPRCAKIRALRTELLLRCVSVNRGNMVALLSPCAGEGRSLLAAELAIAFAQTGHPTLLVDADLHHPQQHLLFGTHNRQGIAQAIEHDAEPQFHTIQGFPQMALLTAGLVSTHPLELLSSQRFSDLVEDWQRNFAFVVIDTAPVGLFADGLAVASLAGNVLTLSRARHTPFADMQDMLRRIAATRSQILGAVISHF